MTRIYLAAHQVRSMSCVCPAHLLRMSEQKDCGCRNFDVDSAVEGKAAAKAELRRCMDLSDADVPIVAVVTRLTHQKVCSPASCLM